VPIVVVDTNVWVSAFLNPRGHPAAVRKAFVEGRFDVAISAPLLEEMIDVLNRPRLRRKYSLADAEIAEFVELLSTRAVKVKPEGKIQECRDPDDDLVLETAILSRSRYLVTRDDDLKGDESLVTAMEVHGIRALTVQRFLELLSQHGV